MQNPRLLWATGRTLGLAVMCAFSLFSHARPVEATCATGCDVKTNTQGQVISIDCIQGRPGLECQVAGSSCLYGSSCE